MKGIIEAISASAKDFGVGFWSVGTLILAIVFVFNLPGIIKALSTFVTEYRKTTSTVKAQQKRLALEIERKKGKILPEKKKETRK